MARPFLFGVRPQLHRAGAPGAPVARYLSPPRPSSALRKRFVIVKTTYISPSPAVAPRHCTSGTMRLRRIRRERAGGRRPSAPRRKHGRPVGATRIRAGSRAPSVIPIMSAQAGSRGFFRTAVRASARKLQAACQLTAKATRYGDSVSVAAGTDGDAVLPDRRRKHRHDWRSDAYVSHLSYRYV
ncbi:hypothetical protein LIG30_2823 [Burkholderia sp. lig30]|nr:hypothetical protein LIG30_2823 [Burkholderia sp. lig30]